MASKRCGGIFSTGKCQLTKQEWLDYGLNPKFAKKDKCFDLKDGVCSNGWTIDPERATRKKT